MIYLNITQYGDEDTEAVVGELHIKFYTIAEAVAFIKKYNKEDYTISDKPTNNVEDYDYVLITEGE